MPNLRINAKNLYLTYAQCGIPIIEVRDRLVELEGDKIEWMVVAGELHQDGNPHLHVQIEYHSRRSIRDATRYFDLDEFHPNVQATRNLKKVVYCLLINLFFKFINEQFHHRLRTM